MSSSISGVGMSGRNFDAFVGSQRTYNDYDFAAKIQEKYWRARQKFLAKIEKKEDSCIVLSDSKLDAKLEIYRSIDTSCAKLTNILEDYQNNLFVYANEENSLSVLLKECAKSDKTTAGKIMSITGKSLAQSSHQRIKLYMPLLRLHQEMDTFHSRAVEDTTSTVDKLESMRSKYRASLLWMKDISERLDPEMYQQLDKFRRVQNQVRLDKKAFDSLQMDVVQKIDLLMASRCNLLNQILGLYQATLLETFEKNYNNFRSVEELIKKEDIYEYEFKALTQLNPLNLNSRRESEDLGAIFELLDTKDDNNNPDNNNNTTTGGTASKNKLLNKEEALIDLLANSGDEDSDEATHNDELDLDFTTTNNDNRKPVESQQTFDSRKTHVGGGSNSGALVDLFGDVRDHSRISENNSDLLVDVNKLEANDKTKGDGKSESKGNNKDSNNNSDSLIDLLKSDLDDLDNNSYFKTLELLQL